MKTFRL